MHSCKISTDLTWKQLETSLRSVDAFFRNDFRKLDSESFSIATSRVEDANLLIECLVVDQTEPEDAAPEVLKHHPGRITIAVVDRTSDSAKEAKTILRSKYSFQGTSPYTVGFVIINQWARKAFLVQCEEFLKEARPAKNSPKPKAQQEETLPKDEEKVLLDVNRSIVSDIFKRYLLPYL